MAIEHRLDMDPGLILVTKLCQHKRVLRDGNGSLVSSKVYHNVPGIIHELSPLVSIGGMNNSNQPRQCHICKTCKQVKRALNK